MADYALIDHVFFVVAFFGVGVWTMFRLGLPGFTERGVPMVPPAWARGARGRVLGGVLVVVGGAFVVLSLLALGLLVERMR